MPVLPGMQTNQLLTRRAVLGGALALSTSLALASCGFVSDKVEEAGERIEEQATGNRAGRADITGDKLQTALDGLAKQLGTKDLKVFDVTITEITVNATVQDPAKPENVDSYPLQKDGTWGASAPVDLIGSGEVEDNVFSAGSVAWDAVGGLIDEAEKRLPIDGAKFSTALVKYSFEGDVQITVTISGTRGSGLLTARADGSVIDAVET